MSAESANAFFKESTERRQRIRRAAELRSNKATLPDAFSAIHDQKFTGPMLALFHDGVLQELRPLDSEEGLRIVRSEPDPVASKLYGAPAHRVKA